MLTLYHGSGSGSYRIGPAKHATEAWLTLRATVTKLLAMRGHPDAATLLTDHPFSVYTGENDFGDEFSILYAEVSLPEYVELDRLRREPQGRLLLQAIARTVTELGDYVRFIAVGVQPTDTPSPVSSPRLTVTTDVVERTLIDAEQMLSSTGAINAVDRVHTALHGYLHDLCIRRNLIKPEDEAADLTRLFKLLRGASFFSGSVHSPHAEKVAQGLAVAIDALNPLRNHGSLAHPAPELLTEAEAMLVINAVRTILNYVDASTKT